MSNQNETVLITGASTGIGRAVARAFLDRDYNLVLNSRDPGRLEAAYQALGRPDNAVLVAGDVSDKAVGQQMVAAALHKFGRVDVLVNNAGVFSPNWVSPSLQFRSLAIGIGSSDDDAVGNRSDNDSLLGESVEEQPPGS